MHKADEEYGGLFQALYESIRGLDEPAQGLKFMRLFKTWDKVDAETRRTAYDEGFAAGLTEKTQVIKDLTAAKDELMRLIHAMHAAKSLGEQAMIVAAAKEAWKNATPKELW